MILGIGSMVGIDARRRAARGRLLEHSTTPTTTRLAMDLAGAVGVLLILELACGLHRPLEPVNVLVAQATKYLLARMDMAVLRSGTVLMHPDGFGYRIGYACSGFQPAALITITMLVLRATSAQRILGTLVAMAVIETLNVGRLIHLYWLEVHQPEAFFVAHDVTWNVIAVVAALAFLGTWLYLSRSRNGA